jgi:hypothetical protein
MNPKKGNNEGEYRRDEKGVRQDRPGVQTRRKKIGMGAFQEVSEAVEENEFPLARGRESLI